ncbi:NAD(P)-dependent oxidoreductase [uncultured Aliivibrio sp.]|uniref:NAD-dependent epimerase/dehydratase family protein n=1 Tax=uncultured Aliivibrio sp. TaxID=873085 RepID=UPI0026057ED9|nr:NAD-dependent epimerase/dehydratase family protein [uncultured Aliivibrio sp.]
MKILITGGLGNLGLWLTYHFLDAGNYVTVIGRTESIFIEHKSYQFISADVTDINSLSSAIDCYYDICIHTASFNEHFAESYSEKALLINSLGTENLCRSLLKNGVGKLIYLSTFHVYGVHNGLIDESTTISPLNDYGLTHYFAEKYIEKHAANSGLKYVIFRLSNSYGCPRDINTNKWYLIFNDFCKEAFEHKRITINGNPLSMRDFIWMGDVVNIIHQACVTKSCLNTCFNLSTSLSVSLMDLAKHVVSAYYELFGEQVDIVLLKESIEVDELVVCNAKLKSILPVNFNGRFGSEAKGIFKLLTQRSKVV